MESNAVRKPCVTLTESYSEETWDQLLTIQNLYKEQHVNENEGAIVLKTAGVSLHIPKGALDEQTLLTVAVRSEVKSTMNLAAYAASFTPTVICTSQNQPLRKPVEVSLPHCAVFEGISPHTIAVQTKGQNEITQETTCEVKGNFCHIFTKDISEIKVSIHGLTKKRVRVVPFYRVDQENGIVLRVWFINDLPSEYEILQQIQEKANFVFIDDVYVFTLDDQQYSLKVDAYDEGNITDSAVAVKELNSKTLMSQSRHCLEFEVRSDVGAIEQLVITVRLLQNATKETLFAFSKQIGRASMTTHVGVDLSNHNKLPSIIEFGHGSCMDTQSNRSEVFNSHKTHLNKDEGRQMDPLQANGKRQYLDKDGDEQKFSFNMFLNRLGLEDVGSLDIAKALRIRKHHLISKSVVMQDTVVSIFLSRLMSFDYRAFNCFNEIEHNEERLTKIDSFQACDIDWLDEMKKKKKHVSSHDKTFNGKVSCRDGIFAVLCASDMFLLQDLYEKLTSCQFAVPLLLTNPITEEITLPLWGLLHIRKSWLSPGGHINEVHVTKEEFPTIAVMRLGHLSVSKSSILNKMLGSVQGKDSHPFFLSQEQDLVEPKWSKGLLEALWFQPIQGGHKKYIIQKASCILNLRGDAIQFELQNEFARKMASVLICMVQEDNIDKYKRSLDEYSKTSHVVGVITSNESTDINLIKRTRLTIVYVGNSKETTIAQSICEIVNDLILVEKQRVLEKDAVHLCKTLKIKVDTSDKSCQEAKAQALKIIRAACSSPQNYKKNTLPLQKYWRDWIAIDRDNTCKTDGASVDLSLLKRDERKLATRTTQSEQVPSDEIILLCKELNSGNSTKIQFLISWLNLLLNEISDSHLKDWVQKNRELRTALEKVSTSIRKSYHASAEKTTTQSKRVKDLHAKETELQKSLLLSSQELDDVSVGIEHLLREVGQLYESQYFGGKGITCKNGEQINYKDLPQIGARLLLLGQPLEILDGDGNYVPLQWVDAVLKAVQTQVSNNPRIFVISILGVQNSGKSTLLNTLFGVKFSVSAGRCTRGVYMQLLNVDNEIKEEIGCDLICVIDTEGLRAPEKTLTGKNECDNELATFALCISDVTLINVSGHTVGDDLTDILQIAAHAFIRMNEVNLKAACRIIQQNVADVTTVNKNESASQALFQKLDIAVSLAAKQEKVHFKYRRFSDVFNIHNEKDSKDLQYIPSLWRTSGSPPNPGYSEKVLTLKSNLLESIKSSKLNRQTICDFAIKIKDVWEAITKEDFVFNFKNHLALSQYKTFHSKYQVWKLDIEKKIMLLELECCDKIKNASKSTTDTVFKTSREMLKHDLDEEGDKMKETINQTITNGDYYAICNLYQDIFLKDLENFITSKSVEIDQTFYDMKNLTNKQKELEETHIPNVRAELRKHVYAVAEQLKDSHTCLTDEIITKAFEETWDQYLKNIKEKNPKQIEIEIHGDIDRMIKKCIRTCCKSSPFSKFLNAKLSEGTYHTYASSIDIPPTKNIQQYIKNVIKGFSESEKTTVDEILQEIKRLIVAQCESYGQSNNLMVSRETFDTFSNSIAKLISQLKIIDLYGDVWSLAYICCYAIYMFQDVLRNMFLIKRSLRSLTVQGPNDVLLSLRVSDQEILRFIASYKQRTGSTVQYLKSWWNNTSSRNDKSNAELNTSISEITQKINAIEFSWNEDDDKNEAVEHFADMVVDVVTKGKLSDNDKEKVYKASLDKFLQKLNYEYRKYLKRTLDWSVVQKNYSNYDAGLQRIKTGVFNAVHVVDAVYGERIRDLLIDDLVEKSSQLPPRICLLRAMDIAVLKGVQTDDFEAFLMCLLDVKQKFLSTVLSRGLIQENQIAVLIDNTKTKVESYVGGNGLAFVILHVCAWAFPFCNALQTNYEVENNMITQLENDRISCLEDFRSCCQELANDKSQAKQLSDFLKIPLKVSIQNKISAKLFWQLADCHDIFTNRRNLLKHILTKLAETDSSFYEYNSYIRSPQLYMQKEITDFVVRVCSTREKGINIDSLIRETISNVVDSLRECLKESVKIQDPQSSPQASSLFLASFFQLLSEKKVANCSATLRNSLKAFIKIKNTLDFESECKTNFLSLEQSLWEGLKVPNKGDILGTQLWLRSLPKQIDIELANRVKGCGKQCPFCNAICDQTISSHDFHFTELHNPFAFGGGKWRISSVLVHDVCTSLAASDVSYCFEHNNCGNWFTCLFKCKWRPFKEYNKDFPDWKIQPISDIQATLYWKWVFVKLNKSFAEYREQQQANLPKEWYEITKENALKSLDEIYT